MKKKWILIICALLAIILPLVITNAYIIQMLFMAVLYAYLSSSWNIVGGFAGQLGIGNGLFVGLGLYLTAAFFVTLGLSPWIGILLAALITALISLILGFVTFPLKGSYYTLSTIALLFILKIIFTENETMFGLFFGGSQGIRVPWVGGFLNMQFTDKLAYYFIMLALLVIVLFISYYMSRSKSGYYFMAISTNQTAASSLGVNVLAYKLRAQFLSAFLMAVGGGVFGMFLLYMDPPTIFSFQMSFTIVLIAMFGGRGTVFGPAIGAFILMPLNELLRLNFSMTLPGLPMALFGLLLMLCLQFMPKGVIDMANQIMQKYRTKKANKKQGIVG